MPTLVMASTAHDTTGPGVGQAATQAVDAVLHVSHDDYHLNQSIMTILHQTVFPFDASHTALSMCPRPNPNCTGSQEMLT